MELTPELRKEKAVEHLVVFRHRLDCLVEHYQQQIAPHMDRLKGTPGTAARRAYIEAVGRGEGPAVAEALRHAFGLWWQANRAERV